MDSGRNILRRIKNRLKRLAVEHGMVGGNDPSKMGGRQFNLAKKQLVPLDGFRLFVMPNDYVGGGIIQFKSYEPHVTSVIRSHLRSGDVFLDIGANVGYFTILASSLVGENGRVLAFEPNPQNQQLIFSSVVENGSKNVFVYPWAASDKEQVLRFTTVGSNGGVINDTSVDPQHLFVQAVVLDLALSKEARIDLVKMDIEAHEPAALRGMIKLINKHRPTLITEFHPWAMLRNNAEPPISYLYSLFKLGYEISIIRQDGALLNASTADDIIQYQATLGETAHVDLLGRFA